jgi:iron complex outermembrane recepter protein
VSYALQNVGQITNRGRELEGSAEHGPFALRGTLSIVDSRVRRIATGYTGDLRPGDRMLEVPARTASLSASWASARWFGSLTASRASDWVNYDRLALAWAVVNEQGPASPDQMGTWLRSFWRTYDGVTRLRLTTSRDLHRGIALVLTGDNLLDRADCRAVTHREGDGALVGGGVLRVGRLRTGNLEHQSYFPIPIRFSSSSKRLRLTFSRTPPLSWSA